MWVGVWVCGCGWVGGWVGVCVRARVRARARVRMWVYELRV